MKTLSSFDHEQPLKASRMTSKPQIASLCLIILALLCLIFSAINYGSHNKAEWLLNISFILIFGQTSLFFITNKHRISSLIVGAYILTVIYFFFSTLNQTFSIFTSMFSMAYPLWMFALLPLLAVLLIYLSGRGSVMTNLKRHTSAFISILGITLVHFTIIAIVAGASG